MKAVVPPPLVMLMCGVLMWVMDRLTPSFYLEVPYRGILFWAILLCGFFLFWSGAVAILRRKTTIHPDRKSLQQPTTLVITGVYRYTRNPIYLGVIKFNFCRIALKCSNSWENLMTVPPGRRERDVILKFLNEFGC